MSVTMPVWNLLSIVRIKLLTEKSSIRTRLTRRRQSLKALFLIIHLLTVTNVLLISLCVYYSKKGCWTSSLLRTRNSIL